MNLYSDAVILEGFIRMLSSKNDIDKVRASKEIKIHVDIAARELSMERFEFFEKDIFQKIFNLILSDHSNEKIGGIKAVHTLIDATSASSENKFSRISDTLQDALRSNTEYFLLELVSDALGHLARAMTAIVSHSDSIERQLFVGLDWLKSQQSHRRFAACHLLKNLASYAPTVFFAKLDDFFSHIWDALWDTRERIRLVASESISACIVILADRTYNMQWYSFIYNKAQDGFKRGTPESCHGSLLVTGELLKHTGDFMVPKFREICKSVLLLRDKSKSVKSAILSLLPQLASYSADIFAQSFLDEAIDILIKYSKVSELRAETLLSTGKLCLGLGPRISDRVEELFDLARDALTQGSRKTRQELAPEAVRCIADMVLGFSSDITSTIDSRSILVNTRKVRAYSYDDVPRFDMDFIAPSAFQDKILALLDPMLQTGLTQELIHALIVVAERIPSHRFIIKEKLVEEAIKILGGSIKKSYTVDPDYAFSWSKKGARFGVVAKLKSGISIGDSSTPMGLAIKKSSSNNLAGMSSSRPLSPSGTSATAAYNSVSSAKSNSNPKKGFSFMNLISGGSSKSTVNDKNKSGEDSNVAASSIDVDAVVSSSPDLVMLALKTLSSLQPPANTLISLLQNSVLPYFLSDDSNVRKEAVVACATTLASSGFLNITKGPSSRATEDIVARLVELMVSDPDVSVRLALVQCLSNSFDGYLSRQHHIESVTLLLADESYDMRRSALETLSRLSIFSPSATLPHLRSLLIRFVSELKNSFDCRLREETAQMVCNFVRAMPLHQVVKAYLNPIVESLSFGQDARLTTACLEAFGEICMVMRSDSINNVRKLMHVVINNIRDSTNRLKQEAAVRTLGQMINASGLVIVPYLQFPQLLPSILDLLYKTSVKVPWTLRREVLRTLGIIGALEPRKYEKIVSHLIMVTKGIGSMQSGYNPETSLYTLPAAMSLSREPALTAMQNAGNILPPGMPNYKSGGANRDNSDKYQSGNSVNRDRSDSNSSSVSSSANRRERSDSFLSLTSDGSRSGDKDKELVKFAGLIQSDVLLEQDNRTLPSYLFMYELSVMRSLHEAEVQEPPRMLPSHENYYSHAVINALVKILKDDSATFHHSAAASAVVAVFRALDTKSIQYIDQILPHFLQMIRRGSSGLQESLLQHISSIVSICSTSISTYLPAIFDIIVDFWRDQLDHVLNLAQEIALATPDLFGEYVPNLLPMLLFSLTLPSETPVIIKQNTQLLKPLEQVLKCCNILRVVLRPYIHLVVPALCKIIYQLGELGVETHKYLILSIKTLRNLATSTTGSTVEQISHVVGRIVHTLTNTITLSLDNGVSAQSPIFNECISTLCAVGKQVGSKFITFDSSIRRVIDGRGIDISQYMRFSADLRGGAVSDYSYNDYDVPNMPYQDNSTQNYNALRGLGRYEGEAIGIRGNTNGSKGGASGTGNSAQKIQINAAQLSRSWDVSQRTTASDWQEWLQRLKIELVRESPVQVIKACYQLSQSYLPLAHDIFHAAFVSCWVDLNEKYRDQLVKALQAAFSSNEVPPEILQTLLNLAEFMEHDVEAFPISLSILAELAQKSHAYAKALHYRELEFENSPETCFESLININKKLDHYDAATGILKYVTSLAKIRPSLNQALKSKEAWLSKLGYWEEALESYKQRLKENDNDSLAIWGQLKCLEALGRWEEATAICNENLLKLKDESSINKDNTHTKAAVIGARAAWSLGQWAQMGDYISQLADSNVEGSLMKAVLAVHSDNFDEAATWIENTRKQLDASISALLAESYSRAYVPLITVQQCSELEEVIQYKKLMKESKILQNESSFSPMNVESSMNIKYIPKRNFKIEVLSELASVDSKSHYSASHLNIDAVVQQLTLHKEGLAEKWRNRLKGSCGNSKAAVHFSKYLINGHNLVFNICEDLESRLEFVTLCRKNGNLALAERALGFCQRAVAIDCQGYTAQEVQSMSLMVNFAALKLQWDSGHRNDALLGLKNLIKTFTPNPADAAIYVRALLKLGSWRIAMIERGVQIDKAAREEVTALYYDAISKYNGGYRAWHMWGLSNYRAIEEARNIVPITRKTKRSIVSVPPTFDTSASSEPNQHTNRTSISVLLPRIVNAITGFLKAISIGTRQHTSSVTQDLLCVLSLWFKYGHNSEVLSALDAGMQAVHVDNWLGVIPQLIARIDHHEANSRQLLHELLVKLSLRHTQALVFPLSVAISSPKLDRKDAAELIMTSLRSHNPKITDQALMVSRELIKVAIVWEEWWHECLEEASRQYFGEGNIPAMIETLTTLHVALDSASTIHEVAFRNTYSKDLRVAWDCIQECKAIMAKENYTVPVPPEPPQMKPEKDMTPMERCVNRAWKYYYIAFQSINKKLPLLLSLELPAVSPLLYSSQDMDLGIPGTYQVNGSSVNIKSFSSTVAIIKSKQRPRKLKIIGQDGYCYIFLLKGHEDLRQDERVMQLFGLVNALLALDRRTSVDVDALSIERYAVIPLSPTAGLISWVPNCDTMHDLIREYRENRRILLNIEHKLMQQMVSGTNGYDILSIIQKLEVFECALAGAAGEDLAKILWLKASNSESWLQRRSNYTRSFAVMSMVGYILGLGDRHPSNIMLLRESGKVLHIDFGDCFEVAMHREKFPEKVPFRLTRMLVKAMEISGIEGNYRLTCEKVLNVLREHNDSLVATLEAFVYDPLISWRLFTPTGGNLKAKKQGPEYEKKAAASTTAVSATSTNPNNDSVKSPTADKPLNSGGSSHGSGKHDVPIKLDTVLEAEGDYEEPAQESAIETSDDGKAANNNNSTQEERPAKSSRQTTPTNNGQKKHNIEDTDITDLHHKILDLAESVSNSYVDPNRASFSVQRSSVRLIVKHNEESYNTSSDSKHGTSNEDTPAEQELNPKAITVIRRVTDKLTGLDFHDSAHFSSQPALNITVQVDKLIEQAMSRENLCQSYVGWCPFW